jgi:hypothetical protein
MQWILETFSSGVRRSWREADHSLPSSAEAKNVGALPHLFIILLQMIILLLSAEDLGLMIMQL